MTSSEQNSVVAEATEPKPASTPRLATTLRAFRHRNFQLFFGGQLISLIGTWMQTVAQAWLVYRLTEFCPLARQRRLCQPVSRLPRSSCWRHYRRPRQSPAPGDRHPDRFHDSRRHSGLAHPNRARPRVAHLRARGPARSSQRLRHSRPPVLSGRHGRQRRSDERHRAEFVDVQWRARHRPRHSRYSSGENRRRLVLCRQLHQLHRRDRRPPADARALRSRAPASIRRSKTS